MVKRLILRNLEGRRGKDGLTADSYVKLPAGWNMGSICGIRGLQYDGN